MRTCAGPGSAAVVTVTSSRRESSCATALTCRPWPSLNLDAAPAELAAQSHAHAESASASAIPRGRHSLSREQVRASQRARMLRAMVDAVAQKGYASTSVADVIGGARASRETFYEHFANKQDCFLAAYDEAVRRLTEAMQGAAAAEAPPAQRFEQVLGRYLDAIAAEPGLARALILIEVYAAGPDA